MSSFCRLSLFYAIANQNTLIVCIKFPIKQNMAWVWVILDLKRNGNE